MLVTIPDRLRALHRQHQPADADEAVEFTTRCAALRVTARPNPRKPGQDGPDSWPSVTHSSPPTAELAAAQGWPAVSTPDLVQMREWPTLRLLKRTHEQEWVEPEVLPPWRAWMLRFELTNVPADAMSMILSVLSTYVPPDLSAGCIVPEVWAMVEVWTPVPGRGDLAHQSIPLAEVDGFDVDARGRGALWGASQGEVGNTALHTITIPPARGR
jgi:hypothetical protein